MRVPTLAFKQPVSQLPIVYTIRAGSVQIFFTDKFQVLLFQDTGGTYKVHDRQVLHPECGDSVENTVP